jgi:hypothetical protein
MELSADDIQNAPLFPVAFDEALLEWMLLDRPDNAHPGRELWLRARKLSAADLLSQTDVDRVYSQRRRLLAESLQAMQRNARTSVFLSVDLERAAAILHREAPDYMPPLTDPSDSLAARMHDHMFRSALLRARGSSEWEAEEAQAFGTLRDAILSSLPPTSEPRLSVAEDGIVWGRAPLRFDLAGGWTDTPPYCLLNGGLVLNVAVELNGQPPKGS